MKVDCWNILVKCEPLFGKGWHEWHPYARNPWDTECHKELRAELKRLRSEHPQCKFKSRKGWRYKLPDSE